MLSKLKNWLIGSVIMKKVIGKLAKHATGAIIGIMSASWFTGSVQPILDKLGITINEGQLETGLVVILIGLFGAAWNFAEHRFTKK